MVGLWYYLSCLTEYPNIFIAGIVIVDISNFLTFLQNTARWRRKLREYEYGSLDNDMHVLKRILPINQIDNICKLVFIIQRDVNKKKGLNVK